MFTRTNVHNVASVALSEIRTLWESGGFVRDFTVTDEAGNEFLFTVFAETRESLAIVARGSAGDSLAVMEEKQSA